MAGNTMDNPQQVVTQEQIEESNNQQPNQLGKGTTQDLSTPEMQAAINALSNTAVRNNRVERQTENINQQPVNNQNQNNGAVTELKEKIASLTDELAKRRISEREAKEQAELLKRQIELEKLDETESLRIQMTDAQSKLAEKDRQLKQSAIRSAVMDKAVRSGFQEPLTVANFVSAGLLENGDDVTDSDIDDALNKIKNSIITTSNPPTTFGANIANNAPNAVSPIAQNLRPDPNQVSDQAKQLASQRRSSEALSVALREKFGGLFKDS